MQEVWHVRALVTISRAATEILIWIGIGLGGQLCATSLLPAAPLSESPKATFISHRGVGGIPTFFFPRKKTLDPNRYDLDPYPSWDATMPRWRLDEIRRAGFDFLRLVVDPGPLLEGQGEIFDRRILELKEAIESSVGADLKIVIDIHVQSHPVWGYLQITEGFSQPAFKRYTEVVRALAELVSAYDPHNVALELFNEPPAPCRWRDRPDWPEQLSVIYNIARQAAPKHTMIVAGSCWDRIEGLVRLDGTKFDQNTIFSFHYYEPFVFTHQGFWGSLKFLEYIWRLPYPPDSTSFEEFMLTVEQHIRAAPDLSEDERAHLAKEASKNLHNYFVNWKVANIETDFTNVQKWASRYGIEPGRVLLGEFGAMKDIYGYKGAAPADRMRWLSDVRTAAERFGYSWCVHALTRTMGITVGDTNGLLDPNVLKALGLASHD
jgi:endoglucanase